MFGVIVVGCFDVFVDVDLVFGFFINMLLVIIVLVL